MLLRNISGHGIFPRKWIRRLAHRTRRPAVPTFLFLQIDGHIDRRHGIAGHPILQFLRTRLVQTHAAGPVSTKNQNNAKLTVLIVDADKVLRVTFRLNSFYVEI